MALFDQIRSRCRQVAQQAQAVTIDPQRLDALAEELAAGPPPALQMDPDCHYLGQGDATLAFFVTLAAVNFGSGYFPALFGDHRVSGYRRIAAALTRHFVRCGPLSAAQLAASDAVFCQQLLTLPTHNRAARELAGLFAASWQELGAWLQRRFAGDWRGPSRAAGGSAAAWVGLFDELPRFRDRARYGNLVVPFYKRAQLLVADLHIAFGGVGPGAFVDIDQLTIMADNLVPHVLRRAGVLRYSPALAGRIARGTLLPPGGAAEVEIRACAVHAGELLRPALAARGRALNALWLDNLLWHRGQHPALRRGRRHLTRSCAY